MVTINDIKNDFFLFLFNNNFVDLEIYKFINYLFLILERAYK
jgi:hypothetical protein